MSWETRADCARRYYTRSRRIAGRVVREYVGAGPAAEVAATLDAARRTELAALAAARREEVAAILAARAVAKSLDREAKGLLHASMSRAGFRLHARSVWRRCRMPKFMENGNDADDPLLMLDTGPGTEPPTTEELRAFLHGEPPPARSTGGGFARQAEEVWAALLAGPDPAAREALGSRLREFRAALGPVGSPLERVLCEQAGVAWLELTYLSTRAAESLADDSTDAHRDFLTRGADRATRKLTHLVKQLLGVRRLLGSAPVGVGVAHPGVRAEGAPAPRSTRKRRDSGRARRSGG
jgi:hypothetical protein